MIYSNVFNNCEFEAYYDEDLHVLHVLDDMRNQPRMSVTNGIDGLIPHLENELKVKFPCKIILYGTDNVISQYHYLTGRFEFISADSNITFPEFKEKMNVLYA